jgi:hypothetical protein
MTQKAHDQARLHAQLFSGVGNGAAEAFDHRCERDAAAGVSLRVEEHLDMPDVVGARAFEIGPGQVVEIQLVDNDGHALIIQVHQIPQLAEPRRLPRRVNSLIG